MEKIVAAILEGLPRGDVKFLFPSEVAADFWRRRILEEPETKAVAADRFLSWDKFKEKLFTMNLREAPANNRIRRFYSEELLNRFSRGEFDFARLIPREYRSTAGIFQSVLSSLLPHLRGFFQCPEERLQLLEREYRGDLSFLYQDYGEFLKRFDFYEPSWKNPAIGRDGWHYRFFFFELLEDLPDLLPQLEAAPNVELLPLKNLLSGDPAPLILYPTALEEVEGLCQDLSSLLVKGVEPGDIVLTLADDALLPLLERTAGRLDLPLDLRMGRPLGEYPAGRFFDYLKTCRDELFSLKSLGTLLLHRGYPWRDRKTAEDLIRFGAENYCLRNLGSRPGEDLWETMFSLNMEIEETKRLRSYYRAFKKGVIKLADAKTFDSLDRALEAFLRQFLDSDRWNPGSLKIFQRIRTALKELRTLERRLTGFHLASPLNFLIQDVSSGIYVPQREEDRGPGIPVYPYRVSAGIYPRCHVLIGLSQGAAEVQFPPLPFLREDQRALLGLEDRDLTEPFIEAYLRSGKTVSASCSRETPDGAQLPPGILTSRDGVTAVEDVLESSKEGFTGRASPEDVYEAELAYWGGDRESLPQGLPSFQREGAAAAAEFLENPRRVNLIRNPLPMEPPLRSRFVDSEGLVRTSAYRLDCWEECPAAFLFQYGWQLGAFTGGASWEDPLEMGRLRHRLCRRVFAAIGEKPFPQNPSEVFPAARRAMEEELRHWENRIPFGRTPFWTVVRRKMEADIMQLLKKESAEFPGFFVQEMEEEHRIPRPDEKLAYSGTIDRVSRLNETLGVVDYKSSFRYSQKSLISAQGEPFSFQMPLYILLLGEEADLVEKAEYYNFAEGKFVSFLKPGQEEVKKRLLTVLERKARAYAREIQSGQFCPPRDCDGCGFRALCRQKYFVRENP